MGIRTWHFDVGLKIDIAGIDKNLEEHANKKLTKQTFDLMFSWFIS